MHGTALHTHALPRPPQPSPRGATILALEPVIDLVNHARFANGLESAYAARKRRNSLHSYIEPDQDISGPASEALRDLPEAARSGGCAVLFAVQAVEGEVRHSP